MTRSLSSNLFSVIIARKENKGKSFFLFSLVFAGFRQTLSAESLLYRREGMDD